MTKTIALRLDDDIHAQAAVAADLSGQNLSDFIRDAITYRTGVVASDPSIAEKAEAALAEIDNEVAARRAALLRFTGK